MMEFLGGKVKLIPGDCLDAIKTLPDASIDSVVTDPPYALVSITKRFGATSQGDDTQTSDRTRRGGYARLAKGFMGKQWDTGDVAFAIEFWREVLRVLKPGGHVAAFGGTRTYHRLACAIEDAGFEIRDALMWHYGSGFPKSHDVSKGIDKAAGAEREIVGERELWGNNAKGGRGGQYANAYAGAADGSKKPLSITAPATDAAFQWSGWGTALKPATEIIVLARKPLSEKTIAANILAHGTGALNIDRCRIEAGADHAANCSRDNVRGIWGNVSGATVSASPLGRWPANIIHDGSPEVLAGFPESKSTGGSGDASQNFTSKNGIFGEFAPKLRANAGGLGDSGSAARFFYSAKADSNDRIGSKHPTVKPVDLMQWLVRLITPPGGVCLDPFAGTGTTGEAAWREGFSAILIEREPEYQADIARRMKYALAGPDERSNAIVVAKGKVEDAGPLFSEVSA